MLLESWDPHGPFFHQKCSVEHVWERVSCVCTCARVCGACPCVSAFLGGCRWTESLSRVLIPDGPHQWKANLLSGGRAVSCLLRSQSVPWSPLFVSALRTIPRSLRPNCCPGSSCFQRQRFPEAPAAGEESPVCSAAPLGLR